MQTTCERQDISIRRIAFTEKWRNGVHGTLKASMTGGAGLGILILLFLASLAYVAFGGTLAFEASSGQPETSIAAVAVKPADVGGAPRNEKVSGSSAMPSDYVPAGYVNWGRGGDGNVMKHEHE
jgi:hypothetical protein